MKDSIWLWVPRVVVGLIIIFLSLFSSDILDDKITFWEKVLGMIIHNIPSILLALILAFTWKKPLWAGICFTVIGIAMTIFFGHYKRWDYFLVIDFPVLLIALSYFIYVLTLREKDDNKAGTTERP
jgi:hypothetical protein